MARKKKTETDYEKLNVSLKDLDVVKCNTLVDSIKVDLKPKTENQKLYWKYLRDTNKEIVIASGSPGTGKTYLSLAYALKALKEGVYENVKILIPTVEASSALKLGYLKGDLESKLLPYTISAKSTCEKILKTSGVCDYCSIIKYLFNCGKIDFEVMSFIRGRTFDNTLLILEEAENLSSKEMILAITRCGENSKIVISGDSKQSDREYREKRSGLEHAIDKLGTFDEVSIIHFSDDDVVRNQLITKILKVW